MPEAPESFQFGSLIQTSDSQPDTQFSQEFQKMATQAVAQACVTQLESKVGQVLDDVKKFIP